MRVGWWVSEVDARDPGRVRAFALGLEAEAQTVARLVEDGWQILARNWRGAGGELDVVVLRGGALRFVEVKARVDAAIDAEEALHAAKRSRLVSAAASWLDANPSLEVDQIAFLVVVVDCTVEPWAWFWLDDAFDVG